MAWAAFLSPVASDVDQRELSRQQAKSDTGLHPGGLDIFALDLVVLGHDGRDRAAYRVSQLGDGAGLVGHEHAALWRDIVLLLGRANLGGKVEASREMGTAGG